MVIRSTFYDTTPGEGVKETTWAQSAASRGALFGVVGAGDLNLSAHPTTPYAVNLSPGKFWAHGVWNETTGAETVQCVAPANNAVRWDLISSRSDWQPTGGGPTSFKAVQGSSTKALPTVIETRPGVVLDQPLWLVKWQGGQTRPQEIIDLRCWASAGGVEVADKLALEYLKAPGAAVKLGSSMYRYEPKGNGVWDWGEYPFRTDGIAYTPNWTGLEYRGDTFVSKGMYWVNGDRVTVQAMFQSGARASLGLGVVGFSLPPGVPAGKDFLQTGVAVANTSGTGGLNHSLFALVGPDQTAATIWADRSPMVTPGRAGIGWGANSSFHVQLEYRR